MVETKAPLERMTLPVKFFDKSKNFGFFRRDGKQDVFFHGKSLERAGIDDVQPGQLLEFDLVPVEGKGGKAINLRLAKDSNGK